jgi:hypothetical protein
MEIVRSQSSERPRVLEHKARRKPWSRSLTGAKVRSALTNGSIGILGDVDHRTAWMRRLRDLTASHVADLGGEDVISEGERRLIQRCAMLTLQIEMIERRWATANDGEAEGHKSLMVYQTATNTLRRTLETLGLRRRARQVGPTLGEVLREGFEHD